MGQQPTHLAVGAPYYLLPAAYHLPPTHTEGALSPKKDIFSAKIVFLGGLRAPPSGRASFLAVFLGSPEGGALSLKKGRF